MVHRDESVATGRPGQPAYSDTGVTDCCREAAGLEKAEFSPPIRGMTSGLEGGCRGGGGDRRLASGGVPGGPGGSGEDGTELLGEAGISAPGLSRFMRWCRRHFARLHACFGEVRLGCQAFACADAGVVRLLELLLEHLQLVGTEGGAVAPELWPVRRVRAGAFVTAAQAVLVHCESVAVIGRAGPERRRQRRGVRAGVGGTGADAGSRAATVV